MFVRKITAAMILVLMAGAAMAAAPTSTATKKPAPKHTPPAVIEQPLGAWNTKITPGLASNLGKNNATLIMISANWCPYCKKIKKDVFPDPAVQAALKKWDCVYIDLDTYPKLGAELKNRTIPFFVMFDKNGREVSRFDHLMNAAEFRAWIDDVRMKIDEIEKAEARLKAKPGDAKALAACANGQIALALKMQNVWPPQVTVNVPERLGAAIESAKAALAADGSNSELKKNIELMEIVRQILADDIAGANPKLIQFAKENAGNPFGADAAFWQAVLTWKRNKSVHDPVSDKMFADYLKLNPNGRFSETCKHRIDWIDTAIESQRKAKEKADKAKTQAAKK